MGCICVAAIGLAVGLVRAGLGWHDMPRKQPRPGTICRPGWHEPKVNCVGPCLDLANFSCFGSAHGPHAIWPSMVAGMLEDFFKKKNLTCEGASRPRPRALLHEKKSTFVHELKSKQRTNTSTSPDTHKRPPPWTFNLFFLKEKLPI